jgi:hypothetical protein
MKMETAKIYAASASILGVALIGRLAWSFFQGPDAQLRFRVVLVFLVAAVLGSGLLFLRRWAAIYISLFSTYWALEIYRLSYSEQIEVGVAGVSTSILLMVPAVATIKYWKSLTKGGKHYF